jgi:hypothetical protein
MVCNPQVDARPYNGPRRLTHDESGAGQRGGDDMTVSATSPAASLSAAAAAGGSSGAGSGGSSGATTGASSNTTYDPNPVGEGEHGIVIPAQQSAVRMEDTTDEAVTLTSSNGRISLRFEDGGDDGLKVTATVDGQQLAPTFLGEGVRTFTMDGRSVTVDVDHYQSGSFSSLPGVGKDHHRAKVTVAEANDPTRTDADAAVAFAAIDDGETMTADGVMDDHQLAGLVYQLTGTDVSGPATVRQIDHGVLPTEAQASRQASSVYLGDFGVGYVEFGPEVPAHGTEPAVFLRFANTDSFGQVETRRLAGSIPPVGSVSFAQEDGMQTTLSWRFRQEGEDWILDGVDVHRTGTDPATGAPIDQSWSAAPSGDMLHATFGELGMTSKDYVSLGNALLDMPGFGRYPEQNQEGAA